MEAHFALCFTLPSHNMPIKQSISLLFCFIREKRNTI